MLDCILSCQTRYQVNILEAKPNILSGASAIATHVHLGAEYPRDYTTQLECINSSVIFKLMMPKWVFGEKRMVYAVSHETAGAKKKNEKFTLEEYINSYKRIQVEYELICKFLSNEYSDIYSKLFGHPSNFFQPIEKKGIEKYGIQVPEAFASQEVEFNLAYLVAVEKLILENKNIIVITNCKIEKITRSDS